MSRGSFLSKSGSMETEIAKMGAEDQPHTRSNYEVFAASEGVLRVTERYEISPPPLKYGSIKTMLVRSKNTQANAVSMALHFAFKDQKGSESSSFLDADEIKSVDAALRHISKNRQQLVQAAKTYTEVDYISRGGFRMGLFVILDNGARKVGEFVVIGRRNAFLHTLDDLSKTIDESLFKMETLNNAEVGEPSVG
jgi:hypothetical protein